MESELRRVVIRPGEDGYWIAECLSLPGCVTQGKTRQEAVLNAREAIRGYIAALNSDHLPVPEEHFDALLVSVSKLPVVSGKDCVKALETVGFVLRRQEGSHMILRRDVPYAQVVVLITECLIGVLYDPSSEGRV